VGDVKDELSRKISFDEYASITDLRKDMIDKQKCYNPLSLIDFSYSCRLVGLVIAFGIYIALVAILVFSAK